MSAETEQTVIMPFIKFRFDSAEQEWVAWRIDGSHTTKHERLECALGLCAVGSGVAVPTGDHATTEALRRTSDGTQESG